MLPQVADELRRFLIESVATSGGHFGAGLGCVELTVALHFLYDTPHDRLVWDVGHQAYPHKIVITSYSIHYTKLYDGPVATWSWTSWLWAGWSSAAGWRPRPWNW